jgi:uncharacterized protein (TIGR00369 family)
MNDANLAREQANASGLRTLLGIGLTEWSPDRALVEMEIAPHHLNRSGLLHGGILSTLLDTALGYAGCFMAEPGEVRRTLTLSLTTNFIASVKAGHLRTEGRRTGGGKTIFFAEGEVRDADGRLIATATGTFKYLSGPPR